MAAELLGRIDAGLWLVRAAGDGSDGGGGAGGGSVGQRFNRCALEDDDEGEDRGVGGANGAHGVGVRLVVAVWH